MTCTFFGHRDFPREMMPNLRAQIVHLIENRGVTQFYVGNQTSLDKGTQRKTTENELPSLTQCTA